MGRGNTLSKTSIVEYRQKNQRDRRSLVAVKKVERLESWPSGRNEDANRLTDCVFARKLTWQRIRKLA